jgi:hypothetical protein
MLPTIEVIHFAQKPLFVQNKNENVKCPELPYLTVIENYTSVFVESWKKSDESGERVELSFVQNRARG